MVERKTAGEVCLDGKRIACQPPTVPPTRIGIKMAIVTQNCYSDARNRRSSGVCRLNSSQSMNTKSPFILSIGGFLGMGSRVVVVPYETLTFSEKG
jgi:hypothetical protein